MLEPGVSGYPRRHFVTRERHLDVAQNCLRRFGNRSGFCRRRERQTETVLDQHLRVAILITAHRHRENRHTKTSCSSHRPVTDMSHHQSRLGKHLIVRSVRHCDCSRRQVEIFSAQRRPGRHQHADFEIGEAVENSLDHRSLAHRRRTESDDHQRRITRRKLKRNPVTIAAHARRRSGAVARPEHSGHRAARRSSRGTSRRRASCPAPSTPVRAPSERMLMWSPTRPGFSPPCAPPICWPGPERSLCPIDGPGHTQDDPLPDPPRRRTAQHQSPSTAPRPDMALDPNHPPSPRTIQTHPPTILRDHHTPSPHRLTKTGASTQPCGPR